MFAEIQQVESSVLEKQESFTSQEELLDAQEYVQNEYDTGVNKIREKFGLSTITLNAVQMPVEPTASLFDEGALEIKLESDAIDDFDVPDALSMNNPNSTDSSEEEDESDIEEFSDSLKMHEVKFRDESSDSGQDDCTKQRKKSRKSDEEKLFE